MTTPTPDASLPQTPRTDKAWKYASEFNINAYVVPVCFAEELERENEALQRDLATIKAERDEARAESRIFVPTKDFYIFGDSIPACQVVNGGGMFSTRTVILAMQERQNRLVTDLATLKAERDEAREKLRVAEILMAASLFHSHESDYCKPCNDIRNFLKP